ncbi:MAG: FecR domain-containing protein [Methyloligellaceae bacterium]
MRAHTFVIIASLAISLPASSATQNPEIGRAELITKDVTGTIETSARNLKTGDNIHQNEVIATAEESEAELILDDETKLAVGPKSEIVLDSFVYDPAKKDGEVIINAAKGAFRFITGKSAKSAYTIKTPASTIGVRGTTFDGFIDESGEIAVLLVDGEINVCNTSRACKRLRRQGYFMHIGRNGRISDPRKWDGTFMGHMEFGRAFPFVGRRLRISPKIRFKRAQLMGGKMLRRGAVPRARPLRRMPRRVIPKRRFRR